MLFGKLHGDSFALPSFLCRVILAALVALAAVRCSAPALGAQETDFTPYARAADFCRGNVTRPIALSPDRKLLCFDGPMLPGQDYSIAAGLEEGGFFVVRSSGGYPQMALQLANFLEARGAIAVVYDYCLSACAEFLLIASTEAIVLRETLVAWHNTNDPHYCPRWTEARDGGPKRFEKLPCPDASGYEEAQQRFERITYPFFRRRLVQADFEMPPESIAVRKRLRDLFEAKASCPVDLLWMWHPRYYAGTIKTKVLYEKYPESQREVNALASRLPLLEVYYDP